MMTRLLFSALLLLYSISALAGEPTIAEETGILFSGQETGNAFILPNEFSTDYWMPVLQGKHGAYIGVGTFRTLNAAAYADFDIVYQIDIDNRITEFNRKNLQLISDAASREEYLSALTAGKTPLLSGKDLETIRKGYATEEHWAQTIFGSEELFQKVRRLARDGKILAYTGSLSGTQTMPSIAEDLARRKLTVSVLDISNVHSYLGIPGYMSLRKNLTKLPKEHNAAVLMTSQIGFDSFSPTWNDFRDEWSYLSLPASDLDRLIPQFLESKFAATGYNSFGNFLSQEVYTGGTMLFSNGLYTPKSCEAMLTPATAPSSSKHVSRGPASAVPTLPEAADEILIRSKVFKKFVDWEQLRELDKRKFPVTIAVINEGIPLQQMGDLVLADQAYDMVHNNPGQFITGTHETEVSSVIATMLNFNRETQHPIRILPISVSSGEYNPLYMKLIADAIDYATTHNAKVINISAGVSALFKSFYLFVDNDRAKSIAYIQAAIDRARSHGVVIIGAMSNDPKRSSDKEPEYPGNLPGVIAVSNVNHKGVMQSSFGANVTLSYLGTDLVGWNEREGVIPLFKGTSFATPLVSASVAMFFAKNPGATDSDFKKALQSAIDKQGPYRVFDPIKLLEWKP